MKNSMLWHTFVTLNKQELKELTKFVASPYFNQKQEIIPLLEYLKKSKHPTKEEAFEKMYPTEAFLDTKARLAMSHLLALIEQFWLYETQRTHSLSNTHLLAEQYRLRNLGKYFIKSIEQSKEKLNAQPLRNTDYHWQRYQLLLEEQEYQSQNNPFDKSFLELIDIEINCNTIAMQLKHICEVLSYQSIYGKSYNVENMQPIVAQIETHQLHEIPVIKLYYAAFLCLSRADDSDFLTFKEFLLQSTHFFNKKENGTLFRIAINYCIKKMNQGDEAYRILTFELYESALYHNVLYQTNYFSHHTYRNIVSVAIIANKQDWLIAFLEEYKDKIEPKYRENTYALCQAIIAFEFKKDYSASLDALNAMNDSNTNDNYIFLMSISRRLFTIKNLMELGAIETAEGHIRAGQQFILNHTKYENYLKGKQFISLKVMDALCKLQQLKTPKAVQKVELLLQENPALIDRKWVLTIFERFKKGMM